MGVPGCFYVALAVVLALGATTSFTEASVPHHRHKHQVNEIPETEADIERKLLIECQHEDYRTYIKCLKREKRQRHDDRDDLGSSRFHCLNECFDQNCTTSACIRDCHKRCRTRLTFTKTVETTYDCNSPDCKSSNSALVPNITTNIHIQNILPNVTNCPNATDRPATTPTTTTTTERGCRGGNISGGSGGGGGGTGGGCGGNCGNGNGNGGCGGAAGTVANYSLPNIDIHNEINNHYGYPNNNYPFNNNPWPAMPQITIGIGGGPVGGCMFPSWPCFQKYPIQQQQPAIDCSLCYLPLFQYRCDPNCYTDPRRDNTLSTTTQRPAPPQWNSNQRRPGT